MGVDIIEAGFPIATNGDFEAVSEIAKRTKNAVIAGLARAIQADIARGGEAVRHARRPRIHTFVSTSPIHLPHQMNKTEEEVLEIIARTVAQARNLVDDVEWSAMDATRTPIDYLCRCVEVAIKAGATTINLPDTVGYAVPDEYEAMFRAISERVPGADKVDLLGPLPQRSRPRGRQLAGRRRRRRAADRMHDQRARRAGRQCGARGGRDGAAHARRRDAVPHRDRDDAADPRVETGRGGKLLPVQYNKAIVGKNAFAHESGIHQDGMLKNAADLRDHDAGERRHQQDVAGDGQAFGPRRVQGQAARAGLRAGRQRLPGAFVRFKDLADRKKNVYDADIVALVDDEVVHAHDRIKLVDLTVIAGTRGRNRRR